MKYGKVFLLVIGIFLFGCGPAIGGMTLRLSPKLTATDFTKDSQLQPYVQAVIDVGHSKEWRAQPSMVTGVRVAFVEIKAMTGANYLLDFRIERLPNQPLTAIIIGGLSVTESTINAFEQEIKLEFKRRGLAELSWTKPIVNFK